MIILRKAAKPQVLELKDGDRVELEKIVRKRTMQAQAMTRARILLLKADGETIEAIAGKAMASEPAARPAFGRQASSEPACGSA